MWILQTYGTCRVLTFDIFWVNEWTILISHIPKFWIVKMCNNVAGHFMTYSYRTTNFPLEMSIGFVKICSGRDFLFPLHCHKNVYWMLSISVFYRPRNSSTYLCAWEIYLVCILYAYNRFQYIPKLFVNRTVVLYIGGL